MAKVIASPVDTTLRRIVRRMKKDKALSLMSSLQTVELVERLLESFLLKPSLMHQENQLLLALDTLRELLKLENCRRRVSIGKVSISQNSSVEISIIVEVIRR